MFVTYVVKGLGLQDNIEDTYDPILVSIVFVNYIFNILRETISCNKSTESFNKYSKYLKYKLHILFLSEVITYLKFCKHLNY